MPKENILLVEDDKDIVEMVVYNLKKEGFRTLSVCE
jgi:DNA-binding response OmpR family regulator